MMKRRLMSVIEDIKYHHQFDDGAQVDYRLIERALVVMVYKDGQKEIVANIELPDFRED